HVPGVSHASGAAVVACADAAGGRAVATCPRGCGGQCVSRRLGAGIAGDVRVSVPMFSLDETAIVPAGLIVIAALLAIFLAWRNARHRRAWLMLLQLPCAALLLAALLLSDDAPSDTLVVLTHGASSEQRVDPAWRRVAVALP